jgi:hypothetical protein
MIQFRHKVRHLKIIVLLFDSETMLTEGEILKKKLGDQIREICGRSGTDYQSFNYQTHLTDYSGFQKTHSHLSSELEKAFDEVKIAHMALGAIITS